MSCSSCVGRVEKALSAVLGASETHVNLVSRSPNCEMRNPTRSTAVLCP
ncbi:MAG: cation transporter [Paracoccaceae bacterium]